MKAILVCVMISLLFGCASQGRQVQYESSEQSAQTLSRLSGATQAIAQLETYFASLADDDESLTDDARQQYREGVQKAFSADALQNDYIEYIRTHISDDDVRSYLPWLQSDLGKYLVTLELASMSIEADAEMEKLGDSLQSNPTRNELIKVLNEVSQVSEFSKDLMPLIFQAMVKGMNALAPENKRMSQSQMASMSNYMYQSVVKDLDNELLNESLFTYREASDKQLLQYIAYLEGDIGKRYTQDMIAAMTHMFLKASERWGNELASAFNLPNKASFTLSECIKRRAGALCIIEQLNSELESQMVTKNTEVFGFKQQYKLTAPNSGWSQLKSASAHELAPVMINVPA